MRRLRRGFAEAVAGVALAVIPAGPVAAHEHFAEDAHGGTVQDPAKGGGFPFGEIDHCARNKIRQLA
jgi:hypothetical protein